MYCTKDDSRSTNSLDNCALCPFKFVAVTACCSKKLCGWHLQDNGEHADQDYYSCSFCESTSNITTDKGQPGFIVHKHTIYCEEHNIMQYCEKCEEYVCKDHLVHECQEWVTVEHPMISEEEIEAFKKQLYGEN